MRVDVSNETSESRAIAIAIREVPESERLELIVSSSDKTRLALRTKARIKPKLKMTVVSKRN